MSERYRYGYGDEPREREPTFSRQGSMTDQRADADQAGRGDEEDEERRADRAEAPAAAPADAAETPASTVAAPGDGAEAPASTSSSSTSVFDVEDEAAGPAGTRTAEVDRADAEPAHEPAGDADAEERAPIALGPPERGDETAGTAKPEAVSPASGTPTDQTPAAVSTGVEAPEPDQAGKSPPGTWTETLVPGSGPAPVAAPVGRGALLGSMDAAAVRARFLDIQAGFVDEPRQAVQEAERFVDELVQDLVKALGNERAKLKGTIEQGSTEDLRLALRGYRAFVDRLLNLTM
jgi:hypothetical protein